MEIQGGLKMNYLYAEQEIKELSARIRRRRIITYIVAAPFFACLVFIFVRHLSLTYAELGQDDTLTTLAIIAGILGAFVLVFGLSFCVKPLKSYREHIRNSLCGRTHDIVYNFKRVEPDLSVIDHISFRSVVFDGEPDKHGITERMFYWDSLKEIPSFAEDEKVHIQYYDRFICGWSREIGQTASENIE